tara:strand:+ start:25799 stop:27217 length:1419 start_codon:yes stop_codon:yes gene_type:complete
MENKMISVQKGKIPPQALDVEIAVLSALLIDSRTMSEISHILRVAEMFYQDSHQHIFRAILALWDKNVAIDLLTVINQLKSDKTLDLVGGEYYIAQLSAKVGSSINCEFHARILVQKWLARELISKNQKIMAMAWDDSLDILEVLEEDARANDLLSEMIVTGQKVKTYAAALGSVAERVEMLTNKSPGDLTGVPTGFKKIDDFTGGMQPSDLIIVGARPGMGKTAYFLKTVTECGKLNIPVGVISLEMSVTQLTSRTVAIDTDFHLAQLIRDGFKKPEYFTTLNKDLDRMKNYPIYIDDTAAMDIRDIIARARIWRRKYKIQALFVDYLQLAQDRGAGSNREQEIASISRNLKKLAKELNIPVMALSQLSRTLENRGDRRPKLSDLRESGAIEQDADIVQFLYREAYYNEDPIYPPAMEAIGANTELKFAKYREGALETKALYFDSNKVKFSDPEDDIPGAADSVDSDDMPF